MFIGHLDAPCMKYLMKCSSLLTSFYWDVFFLLVCGSSHILDSRLLSVLANVLPILKLAFSFQVALWADFQFIPTPSRQPFEVQTQRKGVHHQADPSYQSYCLNPQTQSSLSISQLLPWNLHVFSGVLSLRLTSLGPSSP